MSQIKDLGDGYYVVTCLWYEPRITVEIILNFLNDKLADNTVEWACVSSSERINLTKLSQKLIEELKQTTMEYTYAEWGATEIPKNWLAQELIIHHILFISNPIYSFSKPFSVIVVKVTKK